MTEQDWLEQRKKGIGGSDAAAVIGKSPWKSNIQLWEEKIGRLKGDDLIGNLECVKYGKAAEEHLRALFAIDFPQYEVMHEPFKIYQLKQYPFLQASLDGLLTEKETGRRGILEIKTTEILRSIQNESWNNGIIPDNYYYQVLHYMNVMDAEFAVLKAQLKYVYSDGDIKTVCRHYTLEREQCENDIKHLQQKEIQFWNDYVLTDTQPPLIVDF